MSTYAKPITHQALLTRAVRRSPPASRGRRIQAKLTVSQPHDPQELEADRIAKAVTAGGRSSHGILAAGSQRKCSQCDVEGERVQRKCAACEDDESQIQRSSSEAAAVPTVDPGLAGKIASMRATGGTPLARTERRFFEPRLGADLANVRIHTYNAATAAARALQARAFTVGPDIFLRGEEWRPATSTGRELLAHELVHTLQQGATTVRRAPAEEGDDAGDPGLELSERPTPGKFYRIQKGDNLLGVAGRIEPTIGAGKQRLARAKQINEDPYNRQFHGPSPEGEVKLIGPTRISFMPRFACEPQPSDGVTAAPGKCFATIRIPDPEQTARVVGIKVPAEIPRGAEMTAEAVYDDPHAPKPELEWVLINHATGGDVAKHDVEITSQTSETLKAAVNRDSVINGLTTGLKEQGALIQSLKVDSRIVPQLYPVSYYFAGQDIEGDKEGLGMTSAERSFVNQGVLHAKSFDRVYIRLDPESLQENPKVAWSVPNDVPHKTLWLSYLRIDLPERRAPIEISATPNQDVRSTVKFKIMIDPGKIAKPAKFESTKAGDTCGDPQRLRDATTLAEGYLATALGKLPLTGKLQFGVKQAIRGNFTPPFGQLDAFRPELLRVLRVMYNNILAGPRFACPQKCKSEESGKVTGAYVEGPARPPLIFICPWFFEYATAEQRPKTILHEIAHSVGVKSSGEKETYKDDLKAAWGKQSHDSLRRMADAYAHFVIDVS